MKQRTSQMNVMEAAEDEPNNSTADQSGQAHPIRR